MFWYWQYAKGATSLPEIARRALGSHDVKISPMVRLELQYVYEINRVSKPAAIVFDDLAGAIGLSICAKAYSNIITEAEKQSWTRDPFDRIIVAQAAVSENVLVTKDNVIHKHYPHALWERG
jgi:PIN domain nuclease of toxin-antitoxin system